MLKKVIHRSILLVIGLLSSCAALVAQSVVYSDMTAGSIDSKREFRGAWVATVVNLDWPPAGIADPATQKSRLIQMFDGLQAAGINAVIFQVRSECDAMYQSPYEPWSYWLTGQQGTPPNPFYDPLAFAIEEAHKRGMELHAWFNPYRCVRAVAGSGSYSHPANHPSVSHPDWVIHFPSLDIKILDPGRQAVRNYVATIVSDIVRRYDVDGVHADDYFYPYPSGAFTSITTEDDSTFAHEPRGFVNRADWRRDNVNLLLKQIHDSLQVIKPWVKFGMSPFGIWKNGVPSGITGLDAYSTIFCDAPAWLQGQYIDYVTPQMYWQIGGPQDYLKLLTWWSSQRNGRHFYPGQAPYRISTWSASELPNQIRANRNTAGVGGSIFFRANNGVLDNLQGFTDSLKTNLFRYRALPPVMTWKDSIPPNSPANVQYAQDAPGLIPQLRWTSASAAADGDTANRYVVYRFTTPSPTPAQVDSTKFIVSIDPTSRSTPPTVATSGTSYYFSVSSLDRNNNESPITSPILVQPPPAPTLSYPPEGFTQVKSTDSTAWAPPALAAAYQWQVATDTDFVAPVLQKPSAPELSQPVTGLAGQQTYYWRVRAMNAGGISAYSFTRSFTTAFPKFALPAIPANFSQNIPLVEKLSWERTPVSTSFRVQLSTASDFPANAIVSDTLFAEDTSYTSPQLAAYKIYYWRVMASNNFGSSGWSEVWRFRTATASQVAFDPNAPTDFVLSQNFPNPFNPITTLRVNVPSEGEVSLRVFDVLGREVSTLMNGQQIAGRYVVQFDGSRFPSGTYFAVLSADGRRWTVKMLLLK